MTKRYSPPQQSSGGQIFDAVFLMVLVFLALFLPLWLKIAVPARERVLPDSVTLSEAAGADGSLVQTWEGLSWEAIGQNPTMQGQWAKLNEAYPGSYTLEKVADIVTQRFNYEFDVLGITLTALVVVGYFIFLLVVSEKEYRQVIAEKFD
jgi:hypothetical protein